MLTLSSWSRSRIVFSPSSVTGVLYGLHVWAIYQNVLSSTVPKTLLHTWERSGSQPGNTKWILMSAASSAVDSFGEKKKKKGEWECIVVIVFYTKELVLVTKQRPQITLCCRGDWNVSEKGLHAAKRLLHSSHCLIVWLCLVTSPISVCCIQYKKKKRNHCCLFERDG